MARPTKSGMDYFPFDVDFFEDDKISLIDAEFNDKGCLIIIKLLCKIYKENGYYYQWGDDQCLLFAKKAGAGIVPSLVKEVVNGLVRRSFFDKRVYDTFNILTSSGIQKRYFEATKKRQDVTVFEELIVIDNINLINDNINLIKYTDNTQSKVKESKLKEIKVNNIKERKLKFSQTLEIFLEKYGKDLLNEFYKYWTEPNKTNTKFRQELEKTWELERRLETWAKNDKNFKNNNYANANDGLGAKSGGFRILNEALNEAINGTGITNNKSQIFS
jgi:Domain of unknown function (DUF4373)